MKHKVLLNSRNQNMVSDFFQHTGAFFDTVTTSNFQDDIYAHFKMFQPKVYLVFIETTFDLLIQQIKSLRESDWFNGATVVLVGDADACSQIERKAGNIAELIIRRPISTDNLALRITRYLDDPGSGRMNQVSISEKTSQIDALIQAAETALSEATASAAAAGLAPANAGRRHILVVDDDRTVLKMVKAALEASYDLTTMAGGAMVDKLLAAKEVDLIILDYEMPIETGADVFRRIKKNPKWANIPVCFLTGVSDRAKIMEVMSLKPHGYILKPIDMDMLTSTIKNLIG